MTARSPNAFFLSALLHASVAALLLFWTYGLREASKPPPKIFELVAGAGDNYNATVAPALGTPGGVKLNLPKPPAPKPEPVQPEPAPMTAAPEPVAPKATTAPTAPKTPTIRRQILNSIWRADANAKKKAENERKKLAKEEADRAKAAKASTQKVAKIDTEGIVKGVLGGSTENKIGGAGGTALTVAERSEVDGYAALLNQKLREALNETPGLEDGLRVEAEFHVMADGRLTRGTLLRRSGNEAFDLAVLRAIASIRMPPRPKGFEEVQQAPFVSRAKE